MPEGDEHISHALAPSGTSMGYRRSALLGRLARGDLFDQIDDAATELGIGDARECARQRQTFRGREEIGDVGRRASFAETFGRSGAGRTSLEQEGDRDLEDLGDLLDAAGADPVGAFLVFLDLLKGEA